MSRKILMMLSVTAGMTLTSSVTYLPIYAGDSLPLPTANIEAAAEATQQIGTTTILQKISSLTKKESEQTYTFSYFSYEKESFDGGVEFRTDFGKGFIPEKIHLGKWSGYNGKISVEIISNNETLEIKDAEQDKDFDLKGYKNVTSLVFKIKDDTDEPGLIRNISGLVVSGTVNAEDTEETLSADASCYGYKEKDSVEKTVFSSKTVLTKCRYFMPAKPEISLSKDTAGYKDTADITIENIGGEGNIDCKNFKLTLNIPSRLTVTKIILPEFNNATCKIMKDGKEAETKNGTAEINASAKSVYLLVTPEGQSFTQTKQMTVTVKNTVNSSDSEKISVTATSSYGDNMTATSTSEKKEISFTKKEVNDEESTMPSKPAQPTKPDKPSAPSSPSKPAQPTKPIQPTKPSVSIADVKTDVEEDEDESEKVIVDRTGLNLQTASVSRRGNTIYDFFSNENDLAVNYQQENEEADTDVIEDTEDNDITDDISTNENNPDGEENNEVSLLESSKKKGFIGNIIETVTTNRIVQFGMIAGTVIVGGIIAIVLLLKPSKKNKKNKSINRME